MTMKTALRLGVALLITSSCGHQADSQLHMNAKPESSDVSLYQVKDGQAFSYVMKSNGRGYQLSCSGDLYGTIRLIQAFGFPGDLIADAPLITMDSEIYQELNVAEQPVLDCNGSNYFLYRLTQAATNKYFFAEKSQPTRLYMFGCQALPGAMGLDLAAAKDLDPELIERIPIFRADDADDIHCLKGVSFDVGMTWSFPADPKIMVTPNKSFPIQIVTAKRPDGGAAQLSLTRTEDCSWLNVSEANSTLVLSGDVPASFSGKTCTVTITADQGQFHSESKELSIVSKASRIEVRPNVCTQELITVRDDSRMPTRTLDTNEESVEGTEISTMVAKASWNDDNFKKSALREWTAAFCGMPGYAPGIVSNSEFLTGDYRYTYELTAWKPIQSEQVTFCGPVKIIEEPAGPMIKVTMVPGASYKKYIYTVPTKQELRKVDPNCPDTVSVEVFD